MLLTGYALRSPKTMRLLLLTFYAHTNKFFSQMKEIDDLAVGKLLKTY